ncbi:MAG: methyltransferase domain-containing protein [Chitinophagales bacterium]|nr:methyltransferase domain-containing protein [Chitinophagales bacterium]
MELTSASWNTRYLQKETGWDIGEISTPLKTYFDQLTDKLLKILIPGSGNGYEAEYLFRNGFENVFLIDWAISPLHHFHHRVKDFPVKHLIHQDFFEHKEQYDIIIEQTFFCAIDTKLRSAYAKHAHELLKDGGKLVGLLFDDKLNGDKPPFGGNKEEYLQYFSPYFTIKYFERCSNSIEPRKERELFINLVKKQTDA